MAEPVTAPSSQDSNPKEVALQMVAQFVGIPEAQREKIREIIKRIPARSALQAVEILTQGQSNLVSIVQNGKVELKKRGNKRREDSSRSEDEEHLKALESEMNDIFNS